ncbi:MAG TPA: hypothetical protein VF595_08575 [Tepidisphaeraceae bacterium]|jgi:hypothetical protein
MSIATINESLGKTAPRLNELGKIKIGIKGPEKNGYRPPRKIDHFLITTMRRQAMAYDGDLIIDDSLMAELTAQFGEKPTKASAAGYERVIRTLPIQFAVNEVEDILRTQWVWYVGATQLGARSDGKTVEWHVDDHNKPLPKPEIAEWTDELRNWADDKGNKFFKLNSELSCYIRSPSARFGGVYKFRTTSLITYDKLVGSFASISQLTGGVLRGMPLMMELHAVKVKHRGRVETVYCPQIELHGTDMDEIRTKALEQERYLLSHKKEIEATQRQYRALLSLPGYEQPAEMRAVVDEFYPEAAHNMPPASTVHIDIIDGDDQPPTPDPVQRGVSHSPAEAEEIIDDQVAGQEPDPDDHDAREQAEWARVCAEREAKAAAGSAATAATDAGPIAGANVLDDLDVKPPAKTLTPVTDEERAQTQAAIDYDVAPKPITAKSTADDFLHFVVAHRPPKPDGKPSDPMGAIVIAQRRMRLFLPRPGEWDQLTVTQKKEAVHRVRAGKFPWMTSTAKA